MRLRDVPSTIGWDSALLVARHLPDGSATMRALAARRPSWEAQWATVAQTNVMLADLIDNVREVAYLVATAYHGKGPRPSRPRPYARPWREDAGERRVGSGGIPRDEFLDWYYSTGREGARHG